MKKKFQIYILIAIISIVFIKKMQYDMFKVNIAYDKWQVSKVKLDSLLKK